MRTGVDYCVKVCGEDSNINMMDLRGKCGTRPGRWGITKATWQDPEERALGPEQAPPLVIDTRKSRGDDGVQTGNPILGSSSV